MDATETRPSQCGMAPGVLTHPWPPALSQQVQRMAYSRVHHSIIDDKRFEHVYPDDAALAAWLRLLIVADGTYPAPAPLPIGLKRRALAVLLDAGLIERVGPMHYRVHGLASERQMRSQSGRNAAAVRWHSEGNARREEQSKEEQSTTRAKREPKNGSSSMEEAFQRIGMPVEKPS